MQYLYLLGDGTIGQSSEPPTSLDMDCIDGDTLRVVRLNRDSFETCDSNGEWQALPEATVEGSGMIAWHSPPEVPSVTLPLVTKDLRPSHTVSHTQNHSHECSGGVSLSHGRATVEHIPGEEVANS
jgi:hypothetical protein